MKFRLTKNGLPAGEFDLLADAMTQAVELEGLSLTWKGDEEEAFAFGRVNKHGDRTEYEITMIRKKRA